MLTSTETLPPNDAVKDVTEGVGIAGEAKKVIDSEPAIVKAVPKDE